MIKVLLLDFDGTLVSKDMLSEVIDLVGKKKESEEILRDFHASKYKGQEALIKRINLLAGVSVEKIQKKVQEDLFLLPGAKELIQFTKENQILTILASGSIESILEVYKRELGIDYIIGSKARIENELIVGISEVDYPIEGNFKVHGIQQILNKHSIDPSEAVALGDSRADLPMFEFAGKSIAINPKGGIEQFADLVVKSLNEVEILLKQYLVNNKNYKI